LKSNKFVLTLGLMFGFIAGPVMAETPDDVGRGVPSEGGASIPDYDRLDPALARASTMALNPTCPTSGLVAFSVTGAGHVSQGNPTLLGYQSTFTNTGGGWTPGGGTFIAPCSGLYVFTTSFMREASSAYSGTSDDVFIHIYLNGASRGYAWSGQANIIRSTGTYTVALLLQQGDYVQTYVSSQSGYKRHLNKYDFTGYLVKPY
jgi:hypothetical protein